MEDLVLAFKARFRQLISESGMTYAQVAEAISASSSAVGNWANDKDPATPSVPRLVSIARRFDVALSWLVGECDSRNGLPANCWIVDLDYVDAWKRGDRSVLDDESEYLGAPIPPRAKIMTSKEYDRLERELEGKPVKGPRR
jgi:transcriptional regulator with XRE-family HTH domain